MAINVSLDFWAPPNPRELKIKQMHIIINTQI